jgi:hypothetical protein
MSDKIEISDFIHSLNNKYDIQKIAKISKEYKYVVYVNRFNKYFDSYMTFLKDHMDFIKICIDIIGPENICTESDRDICVNHKENCLNIKICDVELDHFSNIGSELYIYNVNKKEIKQLMDELKKYNVE